MLYIKILKFLLPTAALLLTVIPIQAATDFNVAMVLWRGMTQAEKGFQDRLAESKDHKFKFTVFNADRDKIKLAEIINQLSNQKYDLIYTFGTTVTKAVKKVVKNRPIIFNIVSRPIKAQVIDSWEHSGSNLTGASNAVPMGSAFTALSKVMTIKRLGVMYNPGERNSVIQRDEIETLEGKFGYTTVDGAIESVADIEDVVKSLVAAKVDAVLLPSDSLVKANADIIIPLLNQYKLPSIVSIPAMVKDNGAFIGLGPDYFLLGRLAGEKALAVLDGALPNDIPSSPLSRMSMTVNLTTAGEIGVRVPVQILRLATVVK